MTCDSDAIRRKRLRSQIDQNLKLVYDQALNEELPERFRILIDRLKAAEAERPSSGTEEDADKKDGAS